MILKLTIKKQWFDMILSGEKTTEYRELKPYWVTRLFDIKDLKIPPETFLSLMIEKEFFPSYFLKKYTHIQFFNGAYFSEKLPNFTIELKGIYIGPGVEDWGAENGCEYFGLELGQINTL